MPSITTPQEIKYRSGYKYQLAEDVTCFIGIFPDEDIVTEFIMLDRMAFMTIKTGYAWDGPSGPTWDTPNFMRGSLFHDAGYQLMRMGELWASHKLPLDMLLRTFCQVDGMSKFRSNYVYKGVSMGGKTATLASSLKPILVAP